MITTRPIQHTNYKKDYEESMENTKTLLGSIKHLENSLINIKEESDVALESLQRGNLEGVKQALSNIDVIAFMLHAEIDNVE